MIPVYIFFDPICPWCHIGKARFMRALEQRPNHPFQIEWHPFMLNPDMPAGGMDRRAYLEAKFGGQEGAVRAYLPVIKEAEASGVAMNLEGIDTTPSTLDAHRLVHWAQLEHRQTPVVSALMNAYFTEGRDIGAPEELARIGASQGMDEEMILRLLASDADRDDIRARDADARAKGIQSVPTFVIGNEHVVPGAHPADFWLNVIDEITAKIDADG